MLKTKNIGLFLGPLSFFLILFFFHPEGLNPQANAVLASTAWVSIWWITEVIPIAVTSLLPIILFPLSGAMELSLTTASFGHKYIFLYMGGFIIAIAIEKWNLHKRIALNIIYLVGSNIKRIILGFMLATAFLSMWISNTATSVMMLPIGLAVINEFNTRLSNQDQDNSFGKALMLSIAYSASIGGIATLVGTPPNIVFAGVVLETYNYEITFFNWMIFGLPISLFLLFICWKYLTNFAFSFKKNEFPGGKEEILKLKQDLGPISYEEKMVGLIFTLTAFCWITRSFLIQEFIPGIDDTIIAIFFGIILFLLNTRSKDRKLINWNEAVKMPWGVILLFGGGMALAKAFEISGLSIWLGEQLISLKGLNLFIILIVLIAAVNFLTEITSNLATTAMLLPVLGSLAVLLEVHPFIIMTGATVAASCAFMLPAATPPNAVVFGSGYLRIPDMVKVGIFMNLFSIIFAALMVFYILPILWGIDPGNFKFLN